MNYNTIKRIIDMLIVLLLLPVVVVMILAFSIIVLFDTKDFPIFIQRRGITKARTFYLLKLRTLKKSANNVQVDIFNKSELLPHVSSFCKWLRQTRMDELPQFLNILLGQMSLVGPRPFSIDDLEEISKLSPEHYNRRSLIESKPGITGLWQIHGDRDLGITNLLKLEEEYDKNKSILFDLKIMLFTIPFLFKGKPKNFHDILYYKSVLQPEQQ